MSYESLSHSKWECKYHVMFIPKGRKKELYGKIWKFLGPVFHELARQFGGRKRNFSGERFWARGYAVSTVGFEEEKIRHYIRQQEQFDKKGYDEPDHEQADDETDDQGTF